jgi:hypothetical protein
MSDQSVAAILANLEARLAFHRERAAFHAEQQVYHGEQSALHAAELEKVTAKLETFRASVDGLADLAAPPPPAPAAAELDDDAGAASKTSKLIARVALSFPAGERFTASRVAAEVNRRYRQRLRKPVDTRAAGNVLRRLRDHSQIRLLEEGRPFHEAVYSR